MNEGEHKRGRLGGVYYRSGKRGIFQVSFQDDRGQEVRVSARTTDEAKAAAFLEQHRRRVIASGETGELYESPKIRKKKISECLNQWEVQHKLQGRWSETYQSDKRQLTTRFGNLTADQLTKARIQEYQLEQKQKLDERKSLSRNAQLNRHLTVLTSAIKLAGITPSYAKQMKDLHLPDPPARQNFFTAAQFRILHSTMSPDVADAAMFLFLTGWRFSECCGKKIFKVYRPGVLWSEVEENSLILPGQRNKGRSAKRIPLTGELKALIEKREKLKHPGSDLIFHRGDGRPISDSSFGREFQKGSIAAGVPKGRVHDLRRTRARIWGKSGVNEHTAMRLGGWRTPEVYRRYNIIDESDLILAQERAEKYLLEEAEKQAVASKQIPISKAVN